MARQLLIQRQVPMGCWQTTVHQVFFRRFPYGSTVEFPYRVGGQSGRPTRICQNLPHILVFSLCPRARCSAQGSRMPRCQPSAVRANRCGKLEWHRSRLHRRMGNCPNQPLPVGHIAVKFLDSLEIRAALELKDDGRQERNLSKSQLAANWLDQ